MSKKPVINDPRPQGFQHWVKKFRKVPQVNLLEDGDPTPLYGHRRKSIDAGLEPYTGDWNDRQVAHLLHRTLVGATSATLSDFKQLGIDASVDKLLQEMPIPDPPVHDYPDSEIDDPHVNSGETWVQAPYGEEAEGERIISLKAWFIQQLYRNNQSIHAKMVLFWHNLLPTQAWEIFISKASYQYFNMLFHHALKNYKILIRLLTLDVAMLFYLNGTFNSKEAPDENYARELQELFCIGKGSGAGFTEGDVQAAARVLTGWVVDGRGFESFSPLTSFFYPENHDTSDKQFSSFYGSRVIPGREGEAGAEELDELLDMIFDNAETAKYICRRIYNFFVYSEIDGQTEELVIEPLADIFRSSNYEIKPVLNTLLKSAHFHHELNLGVQIKNPVDFFAASWNTFEMEFPEKEDYLATGKTTRSMLWNMAELGMELADPPSVAGWPAYYQAPQFDKSWITTDTITKRANKTDAFVYWGIWVDHNEHVPIDLVKFASGLSNPEDPFLLIKESSQLLLGLAVSDEVINNLKSILLSGQQSDQYWTRAWNNLQSNPSDIMYREIVETRLKATFQYLLQLAEFQLA
jgi:uncharacterized protein (DUF1800 family)